MEQPKNGNGSSNGNGHSPGGGEHSTNGSTSNGHKSLLPYPTSVGSEGQHVIVQSNLFGIIVDSERLRDAYRYDVTIIATDRDDVGDFSDPNMTPVFLTKKTGNDVYMADRKRKAFALMQYFFKKHPHILGSTEAYYDGQAILYTADKLAFTVPTYQVLLKPSGEEAIGGIKLAEVLIKRLSEQTVPIHHYKSMDNSAQAVATDKTLNQFIQIHLMQHALSNTDAFLCFENGKSYLRKPSDFGVGANETKDLPDGKELKVGSKVSVQIVEGPKGRDRANFAVAIDAKKSAFHKAMNLPDKALEILPNFRYNRPCTPQQLEKLNVVLKGVMISTKHTGKKEKAYKIIAIKHDANYILTLPDKKISVAQYYQEKYNIRLQAPLAPLVLVQAKKETFFPMDVCYVLPDQRVTVPQQTAEQMKDTTKECAVTPIRRQKLIMANGKALEIVREQLADQGAIRVVPKPLRVNGRKLPVPASIQYNNGHKSTVEEKGTWKTPRGAAYLLCGRMPKWAFLSLGCRDPVTSKFAAGKIFDGAMERGIHIQPPDLFEHIANMGELDVTFKKFKEFGIGYVLVVSDDQHIMQDKLKSLERQYEITTQNVRFRTAMDIKEKGRPATIENIVNKMNMKLGGVNYTIKMNGGTILDSGNILVIGIGAVIPPSGVSLDNGDRVRMPTLVGFSANTVHPESFCGDFHVVSSENKDAQLIGQMIVRRVLDEWISPSDERPRRNLPNQIILYRSGMPEGEIEKLARTEVPAIKEFLSEITEDGERIKFTYVVASKDHCVRLFKPDIDESLKGPEQNVAPGTIVDSLLTSPKFRQFYLNSHITLQGTALTPLYTMLSDETGWEIDYFQKFTYNLCYMHQIVNLPTSLPTPLYVANAYADRGRRMLVQYTKNALDRGELHVDFYTDQVHKSLSYKTSKKFADLRINA